MSRPSLRDAWPADRIEAWSLHRFQSQLTPRRLAALLALGAGITVFVLAHEVFPYHTSNHDEAVYLQQAAMLLEGQLTLQPPVVEPFRPWFFVVDGGHLYPKYSPVPAAMFAAGKLLGGYRIALGVIAAAVVWLTYATVAEAFDRRVGLVAATLLFASPIFLVEAAVFLPYVPTLAWNLLFAWAYLRADRTGDRRFAILAGIAIGIAFFARPYTAVLFAAPFVCHALWSLRSLDRSVLTRQALTGALGLAGVAVALGYNALITGSPTTFPYEAFAPLDGIGFGYREIEGYGRVYDPALALRANARNLAQYVTNWSVAAPVGSLLALAGLGTALARERTRHDPRKLVLAGLAVSIPVGQLYFWGTLNLLGNLSDPTDGLVSFLGPYYHLSLVVPTATFGAYALVAGWRRFDHIATAESGRPRSGPVVVLVVVAVLVLLGASAIVAPLSANAQVTEQYERAYEPFEERTFENALVLLPTPYGDWLNHPFQALRNDPGYDGETVYALQTQPFAVIDAVPDRTVYRYTYRGEWLPFAGEAVTPHIQEVRLAEGETVRLSVTAGVPRFAESVSARVSTTAGSATRAAAVEDGLQLTVTMTEGRAIVDSPSFEDPATVGLDGRGTLDIRLFVATGGAGAFSYDLTVPVESRDGTVRALTPRLEVCRSPRLCGGEAAYVPGQHREGVTLDVRFGTDG